MKSCAQQKGINSVDGKETECVLAYLLCGLHLVTSSGETL